MSMQELFGEVISAYTREQAIEDGVLVDVSDTDGGRVFKHPTALTRGVWSRIEDGDGADPATRTARIWDVCYMATHPTRRLSSSRQEFDVIVGPRTLKLWADCGPGDQGEAVITIGFPEDF